MLPGFTPADFHEFYRSDRIANIGNASLAADAYVKKWGAPGVLPTVDRGRRVPPAGRATLPGAEADRPDRRQEGARGPGHQRSHPDQGSRGRLARPYVPRPRIRLPRRFRQAAGCEGFFDIDLPERDRTAWTIVRLIIWSNDLFIDIGRRMGFPDAASAGDFVWWTWNQQRAGKDPLAG